MLPKIKKAFWLTLASTLLSLYSVQTHAGTVTGELVKWHAVTVDFPGPLHDEMDSNPNPFLDYRLQVTFTAPSGNTYNIPGFFDGDGQGGDTGDVWRVRFAPDEAGTWIYAASFRSGTNVAVELDPQAGTPASFDGDNGSFVVADLNPDADGFLKYGRLESIGEYYFKFRDGGFWIKGGMDSPENFLGFEGFDNTQYARHDFIPHFNDWQPGDPDWDSPDTPGVIEDGRGIIGALNYMASQNLNSIYFMPMNIGADGRDVWPFVDPNIDRDGSPSNDNVHYDISKLSQWYTTLDHAQRKDIFLHFVLSDRTAANKNELDNATLGVERKLFYRELVARFGHFNALQWNISEEYNLELPLPPSLIQEFAQYINDIDPYDHPVTVHNHGNTYVEALGPFVGDTRFGVFSVQTWQRPDDVGLAIEYFRTESAQAGHIVPVAVDESVGLDQLSPDEYRKRVIWDAMLSGGGHELFVRSQDSNLNDFRAYETHYEYMWYARKFVLENLPFWEMAPTDNVVSGDNDIHDGAEVFSKDGEIYAVYLPAADTEVTLSLGSAAGTFEQRWYNPRTGQFEGQTNVINAEFTMDLGAPPSDPSEDWVSLVTALAAETPPAYQQGNAGQGIVSMEAEEFNVNMPQGTHAWSVTVPGGQSGTGAMEATPNIGTLRNNNYITLSPRLDFLVEFAETGTHYVWVRGLGDSDGAGTNDSVHVGFNGIATPSADRITGFNSSWTWSDTTMDGGAVATINVTTPGVQWVNVWMREDGLIVDKLVLTTDAAFDPITFGAEGPPESPRGTPTLPEPIISPASGSYFGSVDVSIATQPGSTVYYTTDGSAPTNGSTLYSGPFTLNADATVQAYAEQVDWNDSPVASASYVVSNILLPPVISPDGGTYLGSVNVTITDANGATVHYTTDGSVPTSASPVYTGPFVLTQDATVRAISVLSGFTDSPEASVAYTITADGGGDLFLQSTAGQGIVSMEAENYQTNTPQGNHTWSPAAPGGQSGLGAMEATPNLGTAINTNYAINSPRLDFEVEFAETGTHYVWVRGLGDSDGASRNDSVHIGLDGQELNTSDRMTGFNSSWTWSDTTMDGGAVATINVTTAGAHTVNVWMREDGLIVDKLVLTTDAAFDPITFGAEGPPESPRGTPTLPEPIISPASGSYFGSVDVTISAQAGAIIYYETDGTPPTTSSNLYTGSFNLNADSMVRAFAVQPDFNDSPIAGADYTISNTLLPPTISPDSGAYLGSVTVSMTETAGAAIHYTIDDTPPSVASALYTGPFVLTQDATVRAISVLSGFTDSPEASVAYTITADGGGDLFLQSTAGQGIVSMEAENYQTNTPQGNHTWSPAAPGGQSGLGAMEATPNLGTAINTNYAINSPRLDFEVEFAETGTHYVWVRGLGDSDGASRNDSVHIGLDGQELNTSDRMTGFNSSWTWSDTTMDGGAVATINVTTAGAHTVNVWMREDGLIVDKLVLTTDAAFDPITFGAEGPPESPRGTPTLPEPIISPASGSYFGSVDVTISAQAGAIIYYETDGTPPTTSSNLYTGSFNLNADSMVRAFAVQPDFNDSPIAGADYTISNTLLPPTISPDSGAYLGSVTVSMTETVGAAIHYTIDDTPPSVASALYTGPFVLTQDATVRAISVLSGFTDSPEASAAYTITADGGGDLFLQSTAGQGIVSMEAENYQTNTPQGNHTWSPVAPGGQSGLGAMEATPNLGTAVNTNYAINSPRLDFEVEFAETGTHYVWVRGLGDSDGASRNDSVHIGLDGQELNTSDRMTGFNSSWTWSDTTMDGGAVATINVTTAGAHTVNVWMREDGLIVDKLVLTTDAAFDPITFGAEGPPESPRGTPTLPEPIISPASGSYFGSVDVTISAQAGATIYYETDGTPPTTSSNLYTGSFNLNADSMVRAFAVQPDFNDSPVAGADYTISTTLLPPAIMPGGQAYLDQVEITMTETSGAAIHYTTDDTAPTSASTLYAGPFTLTESATVRAITVLSGFSDSPEAVEVYTISPAAGGGGLFQQSQAGQGIVSLEAENFNVNVAQGAHQWEIVLPGGQSGLAAMQANPNNGTLINSDYAINSPRLDFIVEFFETGTHYVWVRGIGDSSTSSINDSMHVGLDGQEINTADRITVFNSNWTWTRSTIDNSNARFEVDSTGIHAVNVWMREDGLIFDKLVLTTDPNFNPTDTNPEGPPESPRVPGLWPGPVLSPMGGTFSTDLTVSITGSGNNAIRYTTDGSIPTTSSPVYNGPFLLTGDTTVRAITVGAGLDPSNFVEGIYTQTACQDIRIMPVGDSITLGRDSMSQPPPGLRTSYRRDLYFSLVEAGYNVDFVGSMDDGQLAIPVFDSNHEGHGGETDNFVAANIFSWLVANPADYILLHIGTNGVTTSTADIESILDEVDRYNPNVHVVVARIINRRNYSQTVTDFNNGIDALVASRISSGDLLSVVDMENALTYPDDLVDNLHPTATGFRKMADAWFADLDSHLPACVSQ